MSDSERWLHAGVVGRAHGLDGSFHVVDPVAALLEVGAVLSVAGAEQRIVRRAGFDARPILRLEGCRDRLGVESLRGQELLAAREQAPELGPDEWWAHDLEGCSVCDHDRQVGIVTRLLELPSCEVLEVARSAGGAALLIPLVADAVREVDLERREIQVDLAFLGEA